MRKGPPRVCTGMHRVLAGPPRPACTRFARSTSPLPRNSSTQKMQRRRSYLFRTFAGFARRGGDCCKLKLCSSVPVSMQTACRAHSSRAQALAPAGRLRGRRQASDTLVVRAPSRVTAGRETAACPCPASLGAGMQACAEKTGVLFVCLGNICRSPTAEAVFTDVVQRAGVANEFRIDSCGTGGGSPDWYLPGGFSYHEGALPYARRVLASWLHFCHTTQGPKRQHTHVCTHLRPRESSVRRH